MVLPPAVFLVKAAGWVQGITFILLNKRSNGKLRADDVTASSLGSPGQLLAYRLVMLAWALFISLKQLLQKGRRVFIFYTVWNWWLLTAFFALASLASLRARRNRHGKRPQRAQQGRQHGADWLCRATVATFCVVTPMCVVIDALTWLVLVPMLEAGEKDPARAAAWRALHHNFDSYNMSLAVDVLTWALLVPLLLDSPDLAAVSFWRQRMFSFDSYNQHGVNAVMMLGELALNRMPVNIFSSGWLALWSSLYGVWSAVFFVKTGRFIYPFLDAHKPYAWVAYLGLFAVHWAAFLAVMGLSRVKQRLLRTKGGQAAQPTAHPLATVGSRQEEGVRRHAAAVMSGPKLQMS